MSPHHRLLDSVRGTKKTLYIVAALYVVVGFFLAVAAAVQGDRLGTFLGFVIISGALVTAALFRAVLRIGLRISSVGESLDDVATRLTRIEHHGETIRTNDGRTQQHAPDRVIDLGASAPVDASLLAAATLSRESFPRLADAMVEQPPASACHAQTTMAATLPATKVPHSGTNDGAADYATRHMLQTWKTALREEDLATCRSAYAALVDTA